MKTEEQIIAEITESITRAVELSVELARLGESSAHAPSAESEDQPADVDGVGGRRKPRKQFERATKVAPPVERFAYTVVELAQAVRLSDQQIYNHIRLGDITPKYSGRKALIPIAEARRFFDTLPDEDLGPLV